MSYTWISSGHFECADQNPKIAKAHRDNYDPWPMPGRRCLFMLPRVFPGDVFLLGQSRCSRVLGGEGSPWTTRCRVRVIFQQKKLTPSTLQHLMTDTLINACPATGWDVIMDQLTIICRASFVSVWITQFFQLNSGKRLNPALSKSAFKFCLSDHRIPF